MRAGQALTCTNHLTTLHVFHVPRAQAYRAERDKLLDKVGSKQRGTALLELEPAMDWGKAPFRCDAAARDEGWVCWGWWSCWLCHTCSVSTPLLLTLFPRTALMGWGH